MPRCFLLNSGVLMIGVPFDPCWLSDSVVDEYWLDLQMTHLAQPAALAAYTRINKSLQYCKYEEKNEKLSRRPLTSLCCLDVDWSRALPSRANESEAS